MLLILNASGAMRAANLEALNKLKLVAGVIARVLIGKGGSTGELKRRDFYSPPFLY